MVAHLGLRTHELLHEDIGNIIADILSAWEKTEYYNEVANPSQRFFTLIQHNDFCFLLHLWYNTLKNRKIIILS